MATPSEKLASSLETLKELQSKGNAAIKGSDLTQTHRERLIANGFIKSVLKGWYIPTKPDDKEGDSTSWYASFWEFSKAYLNDRFSDNWVLSPEQSIAIHSGNWSIPKQLLVKSPEANNNSTDLLFGTSIFDIKSKLPDDTAIESVNGILILSLPHALIQSSPSIFTRSSIDARTALALIRDASQVLDPLLSGGHSVVAGRLSGAFRNIGNTRVADDIVNTMRSAGYDIREQDPFDQQTPSAFNLREKSPYVNRINMMWSDMREIVIESFPEPPGLPDDKEKYIKSVEDIFVADAYNSLSIEGYMVTEELIERVRSGTWNPEQNEEDLQQRNAMAARGYWQTFQLVKESIIKVLSGENAGQILDVDHGGWYRELFAPSVAVGILKPSDLAGYRNGPVYIKNSQHVPLNRDALRDAMPAFFELLEEESEASVRTLLGHFIFVYIHPYMDGNGRIARFLMNTMLASGGYPWTIIEVKERKIYMEALEEASVRHNIKDFAEFVGNKVKEQMIKK